MMDTEGSEIHTQELDQPIKADVGTLVQVSKGSLASRHSPQMLDGYLS